MPTSLHHRLLPVIACMLIMNAVASPLSAHNGMRHAQTTSQEQSPPPCHEHENSGTTVPTHSSGSMPCCGDGLHCGCMNVPAGLVLVLPAPAAAAAHDPISTFVRASAPETPPELLLRPPIS